MPLHEAYRPAMVSVRVVGHVRSVVPAGRSGLCDVASGIVLDADDRMIADRGRDGDDGDDWRWAQTTAGYRSLGYDRFKEVP